MTIIQLLDLAALANVFRVGAGIIFEENKYPMIPREIAPIKIAPIAVLRLKNTPVRTTKETMKRIPFVDNPN